MVQVAGVTYRVERTEPHCYAVFRLLDDVLVGTFRTLPGLRLSPTNCDVNLFRDIVRATQRAARTSAVMHLAPAPKAEEDAAAKSPSTVPPRPVMA
jgi:hypothetical protein